MEDLTREEMDFIDAWISICEDKTRMMEETQPGWEAWVAKPVINHRISPGQARTILEVFGIYADKGHNVLNLIRKILIEWSPNIEKKERQDAGEKEEENQAEP